MTHLKGYTCNMRKRMILVICMAAFLTACSDKAAEGPAVQPIAMESETTCEAATEPESETVRREEETEQQSETVKREEETEPESETARREEETTGQTETDAVLREYDALFPVYMDGHEDYIDRYGNLVTNHQFDRADFFYEGLAVVEKDGLMGAIDLTGTIVIPIQYQNMEHFSCGLAAVTDAEGKVGYINRQGEVVIPFEEVGEYDHIGYCSENIVVVERKGRFEFWGSNGEKICDFCVCGDYVSNFHDGYIVVDNAYYDTNGKFFKGNRGMGFTFLSGGGYLGSYHEGVAAFPELRDEYLEKYAGTGEDIMEFFNFKSWYNTYIDTEGRDIFNKTFDRAGDFSEGLAVAEAEGRRGVIDMTGNFVFYEDTLNIEERYSEGCISYYVKEEGKRRRYGFLDHAGNEVIPATYYFCNEGFHDGLALMSVNDEFTQWAYINKKNEVVYTFDVPKEYAKYYDRYYY